MSALLRECGVVRCGRPGAGCCPTCQTVYCSTECQQEDWPVHRHGCPRPPPLEWFTSSTSTTSTGQEPQPILEEEDHKPLECGGRGGDPPQKILEHIQGDLKICQERLDRLEESSLISPSRPRINQENPATPDSPIKSLVSQDIMVNPPERQESQDKSTNQWESSDSPTKPRESVNNPNPTSTPENADGIIKTKKSSVDSIKPPESSLSRVRQMKMMVKEAKLSTELPQRTVEKKRLYEVLPVEHFQSPSDFSIRLKSEVRLYRLKYRGF